MNASQFMDKQIMDLTSSSSSSPKQSSLSGAGDFLDLMNRPPSHQDDDDQHRHFASGNGGIQKEEIVPSYDFHLIRPITAANPDSSSANRTWNSIDARSSSNTIAASAANSILRNYGSMDSIEPGKIALEKENDRTSLDAGMLSEIDRTMKKYADNLLHVLDGVSARLTQLESRTRNLENSVDDLKVSVGSNHGNTDGKMRQLENILREVQTGVQGLQEKQGIVEAQLRLTKLQISKVDQQQLEPQNTGHNDAVQQSASAPPQSHQQLPPPPPPPVNFPQSTPPAHVPAPAVPPSSPIPQQNPPLSAPLPNQFPPNQISSVPQRESYYPPPGQPQEPPNLPYQAPPPQQPQPPQPAPAAPLHQPYQPAPQPPYSQPPPPPQPSLAHHPEDAAYLPSPGYPPNLRQQSTQLPSGPPPPQQYYGSPSHMFEPPSSRSGSGFATGYGLPSGPTEPYPYGGSPSQHGGSTTMKPPQLPQSGGSGYPQLPTARMLPQALPQALPTASAVGGSGSSGTANRVPLDDVVDKVTSMGFPREAVRATVRKLTENGQSVDLNIVLDKLMNDGDIQPPRGWFGR